MDKFRTAVEKAYKGHARCYSDLRDISTREDFLKLIEIPAINYGSGAPMPKCKPPKSENLENKIDKLIKLLLEDREVPVCGLKV